MKSMVPKVWGRRDVSVEEPEVGKPSENTKSAHEVAEMNIGNLGVKMMATEVISIPIEGINTVLKF